jgi:hypothetical protein
MGMTSAGMMAAGTVMGAMGQMQAGDAAAAQGAAQQRAEQYKAAVLTQQAGQERAAGQRAAEIQRRNATLVNSTIRARAAASGAGGGADPTVATLEGRVAGMGEYQALSALYSGEEKARGEENQSALDIFQGQQEAAAGKAKQSAAQIGAFSTLLTGAGSLYNKYGAGQSGGGNGVDFSYGSGSSADTLSTFSATLPSDL